MKKILFATTALVVTAGAAAADITVSGGANMGVKYVEDRTPGETFLYTELDFGINASSTTDSGLEFGATLDLDATYEDNGVTQGDEDNINLDPETYISSGGLTLIVGNVDPATDPFGMDDIGFDGIGVDDVGEDAAPESAANMLVSYTMGDITFSASADGTGGDDWAIAVAGSVSGLAYGLSYEESAGVDNTWIDLAYTMGDFTIGGFYVSSDDDGYGLEAAYGMGDLTLKAAYSINDSTDADAYGVGAAYALGSGLTVEGGVGANAADATVADFGLVMSF